MEQAFMYVCKLANRPFAGCEFTTVQEKDLSRSLHLDFSRQFSLHVESRREARSPDVPWYHLSLGSQPPFLCWDENQKFNSYPANNRDSDLSDWCEVNIYMLFYNQLPFTLSSRRMC